MRYSKEIKDFIAAHVEGRSTKELITLVNNIFGTEFTESKMRSYKKNHNLRSGIGTGRKEYSSKVFPEEVHDYIKSNYKGIGPKEMVEVLEEQFGISYQHSQLKSFYRNHGLNSGLTGYFKKGHTPANKGKKGIGGYEPTQFKKGHIPVNYRPVGSERISKDGYLEIKTADPNKWRKKHAVVWEEANNREITKDHVVAFADGDKRNLSPDNLILLKKSELLIMNRNRLFKTDPELTKAGASLAKLKGGIYSIERKKRSE